MSQLYSSLFLKASVGRQSPRVVPYPAHSLCPGEPGLQSAAGSYSLSTLLFVGLVSGANKAPVISLSVPFSFQRRPNLLVDSHAICQRRKVLKMPELLHVSICPFLQWGVIILKMPWVKERLQCALTRSHVMTLANPVRRDS